MSAITFLRNHDKPKIIHILFLSLFFFISSECLAKRIYVLRCSENTGVINEGLDGGVMEGDTLSIIRQIDKTWRIIANGLVTKSEKNISRIIIIHPILDKILKEGDFVVKKEILNNHQLRHGEQKHQTMESFSPIHLHRNIHLGPSIGIFIPLGNIEKLFDVTFTYGGYLGWKLRNQSELSFSFFYTTMSSSENFWNLDMVGRKTIGRHFIYDIGYCLSYSNIDHETMQKYDFTGVHSLGFCIGCAYAATIDINSQFEIGFHYYLYPHYTDKLGHFINIKSKFLF